MIYVWWIINPRRWFNDLKSLKSNQLQFALLKAAAVVFTRSETRGYWFTNEGARFSRMKTGCWMLWNGWLETFRRNNSFERIEEPCLPEENNSATRLQSRTFNRHQVRLFTRQKVAAGKEAQQWEKGSAADNCILVAALAGVTSYSNWATLCVWKQLKFQIKFELFFLIKQSTDYS